MEKLKLDVSKVIKRLEIATKGLVGSKVMGGYKSSFRGKGLEFDSYRYYSPQEDSGNIDWKASLRAGDLLVKQYMEERNLEVFFLVDTSSSMVYGTEDKLKSEYAAEVVAGLSFAILRAGDSVGMVMFNDRIIKRVALSKNLNQFYLVSRELIDPYHYGRGYNLEGALKFLIGYLKRRAVVIIVSDFIGLKGEWEKYLRIAGSKYDLIGMMVRDPVDRDLPSDNHQILLANPYSGEQLLVVPNEIKADYGAYTRIQENAVKDAFARANCDFIKLVTNKAFAGYLTSFFRQRKAKAR